MSCAIKFPKIQIAILITAQSMPGATMTRTAASVQYGILHEKRLFWEEEPNAEMCRKKL